MAGAHGFSFVVDEELSEGNLLALVATSAAGQKVLLYAEVELAGRRAVLRQFAIYGVNVVARELGPRFLRQMADDAMEVFDVDCIRLEEARRTSGAVPGRTIRAIEFRRRH